MSELLRVLGELVACGLLFLCGAGYGWVTGYQRAESMHPTDHDHEGGER